jgi:hypothetical protein
VGPCARGDDASGRQNTAVVRASASGRQVEKAMMHQGDRVLLRIVSDIYAMRDGLASHMHTWAVISWTSCGNSSESGIPDEDKNSAQGKRTTAAAGLLYGDVILIEEQEKVEPCRVQGWE